MYITLMFIKYLYSFNLKEILFYFLFYFLFFIILYLILAYYDNICNKKLTFYHLYQYIHFYKNQSFHYLNYQ